MYGKHLESQYLLAYCMNRRGLKDQIEIQKVTCNEKQVVGEKRYPGGIPEQRREPSNVTIRCAYIKNR